MQHSHSNLNQSLLQEYSNTLKTKVHVHIHEHMCVYIYMYMYYMYTEGNTGM